LKTEDCGCTLNPIAELVLGEAGGVIKPMEPLGSWLIGLQEVPPKGLAAERFTKQALAQGSPTIVMEQSNPATHQPRPITTPPSRRNIQQKTQHD
jgi:hypothetical protein